MTHKFICNLIFVGTNFLHRIEPLYSLEYHIKVINDIIFVLKSDGRDMGLQSYKTLQVHYFHKKTHLLQNKAIKKSKKTTYALLQVACGICQT